jgi:hypothetical protein
MKKGVSPEVEEDLRKRLREKRPLRCPGCDRPLVATPVPPRNDVAYVRDRVLLECVPCVLRLVIDRR